MAIIRDTVTEALLNFLATDGERIARDVLHSLARPRGYMSADPLDESPDPTKAQLGDVLARIEAICAPHAWARLLVLFRKIPHEIVLDLIRLAPVASGWSFRPIYNESLLFGTNCILEYSAQDHSFHTNSDRYRFVPSESEMEAAICLMLLAFIHSIGVFYLNSLYRRSITTNRRSLEQLLDVYNRRLGLRWNPELCKTIHSSIIYPMLVASLPSEQRIWRCRGRNGTEFEVSCRNWIPVPCDGWKEIGRFAYLDTADFEKMMGIDFSSWSKVWLGLNRVLTENIAMLWQDSWFQSASPELLRARVEYADDYCETALGSGRSDSIWETCYELLARENSEACPTLGACRRVVEGLTFRGFDGDIRFIEQPFVFYQAGSGLIFWDYMRHGGLLRCISRRLMGMPGGSATRRNKGSFLEGAVRSAIEQEIEAAVHLKMGVKIKRGGREVWDIDVSVVCEDVLFLIEVKNRHKSVRYYFDDVEVSDRVLTAEGFLSKQDERLRQFSKEVSSEWGEVVQLSGAICVVCSDEAEFIASCDEIFWLKRYSCPRVCLVSEFIEFIKSGEIDELRSHPAFVAFKSERLLLKPG